MIFSKNKFYDRKESFPTNYYRIRSQQFFEKFLRSPLKYCMIDTGVEHKLCEDDDYSPLNLAPHLNGTNHQLTYTNKNF